MYKRHSVSGKTNISHLHPPGAFDDNINGVCLRDSSLSYPSLPTAFLDSGNDGIKSEVQFLVDASSNFSVAVGLLSVNASGSINVEYGAALVTSSNSSTYLAMYIKNSTDAAGGSASGAPAVTVILNPQQVPAQLLASGIVYKLSAQAVRDAGVVTVSARLLSTSNSLLGNTSIVIPGSTWVRPIFTVRGGSARSFLCVRYVEVSTLVLPCPVNQSRANGYCVDNNDCAINNGGCSSSQTCSAVPPSDLGVSLSGPSAGTTTTSLSTTTTATTTTTMTKNLQGNYCTCKPTFEVNDSGTDCRELMVNDSS